ncbi:hypothetical protein BV22DRAFT_1050655 [Leucogyrophana mollusca]|uniref:Uncharacterized protein n=1 Tax=Leucogyrophana mollusca TaxID=85980 RepID=A0ACB8B2V2_9AGAM|nr:hypothetical protein BV22DRAFT_1050655 [Leucogyrophana mollusca]
MGTAFAATTKVPKAASERVIDLRAGFARTRCALLVLRFVAGTSHLLVYPEKAAVKASGPQGAGPNRIQMLPHPWSRTQVLRHSATSGGRAKQSSRDQWARTNKAVWKACRSYKRVPLAESTAAAALKGAVRSPDRSRDSLLVTILPKTGGGTDLVDASSAQHEWQYWGAGQCLRGGTGSNECVTSASAPQRDCAQSVAPPNADPRPVESRQILQAEMTYFTRVNEINTQMRSEIWVISGKRENARRVIYRRSRATRYFFLRHAPESYDLVWGYGVVGVALSAPDLPSASIFGHLRARLPGFFDEPSLALIRDVGRVERIDKLGRDRLREGVRISAGAPFVCVRWGAVSRGDRGLPERLVWERLKSALSNEGACSGGGQSMVLQPKSEGLCRGAMRPQKDFHHLAIVMQWQMNRDRQARTYRVVLDGVRGGSRGGDYERRPMRLSLVEVEPAPNKLEIASNTAILAAGVCKRAHLQ